ncbi:MAG: hypothetical protein H7175_09855 [Burkholderiales bacterium]|nr:hypothetical protein [Anaerolineae bacterium]
MRQRMFFPVVVMMLAAVSVVLAACGADQNLAARTGPRLVQDVTLAPTTPAPTRLLSPTPSPVIIPVTSEIISPLEIVTIEADFELITPTLPPSKTMTLTPSMTPTLTVTVPPTITPPFTLTIPPTPSPIVIQAVIYPTAVLQQQQPPPPAPVAQPIAVACSSSWFFVSNPAPPTCPTNLASETTGAFQQFQNGAMFWVENQDAIYVLYTSASLPRWEVFNDTFEDGMPEIDPSYANNPAYTYQPRRGFGLIWRNNQSARERLGWALSDWEFGYPAHVQVGDVGTVFLNSPRGGIYGLEPGGADWKQYDTPGF